MKKYLKRILFALFVSTILCSIFSCQKESRINSFNKYLSLSVKGNIIFEELSDSDKAIIYDALSRISIVRTDDGYSIDAQSAKDINVSEQIYNWLKNNVANSNDYIQIRVKSDFDEVYDDTSINNTNDCVIKTIVCAASRLGRTYSADSVANRITGYFRDGIGPEDYYEVLGIFFQGYTYSPRNYTYTEGCGNAVMGAFMVGREIHSVVLNRVVNGLVMYYDPQKEETKYIELTSFVFCYQATEAAQYSSGY